MRVVAMKYFTVINFESLSTAGIDVSKIIDVKIDQLKDGHYINNLNKPIKNLCLTLKFDNNYIVDFLNKNPLLKHLFDWGEFKILLESVTPDFFKFIEKFYLVHYIDNEYRANRQFALLSQLKYDQYSFLEYNGNSAFYKNMFFVSNATEYNVIPYDKDRYKSIDNLIPDYSRGKNSQPDFRDLWFKLLAYIMNNVDRHMDPTEGQQFIFCDDLMMEMTHFGYTLHKKGKTRAFYETTNINKVVNYITNYFLQNDDRHKILNNMLES